MGQLMGAERTGEGGREGLQRPPDFGQRTFSSCFFSAKDPINEGREPGDDFFPFLFASRHKKARSSSMAKSLPGLKGTKIMARPRGSYGPKECRCSQGCARFFILMPPNQVAFGLRHDSRPSWTTL